MAAFSIRYVRTDADGGNDGLTNSSTGAWTLAEAFTNYAAGQEIRIMNTGTYSLASNTTITTVGTSYNPVLFIGRKTDDSAYENSYINAGVYYLYINAAFIRWCYIDFYSTSTSYAIRYGGNVIFYRCKIKNDNSTTTTGTAMALYQSTSAGGSIVECYLENVITHLISSELMGVVNLSRAHLINSKIVTKDVGVRTTGSYAGNIIRGNLIIGNGIGSSINQTSNVNLGYLTDISHNTMYNFNYGIYFNNLEPYTTVSPVMIMNNLFHSIKDPNPSADLLQNGYCIYTLEAVNKPNVLVKSNRYYDCDNFSNCSGFFHEIENEECTSDPFTYTDPNPSFDSNPPNYTLNNVSGGGLSCKNQNLYSAFNNTWSH